MLACNGAEPAAPTQGGTAGSGGTLGVGNAGGSAGIPSGGAGLPAAGTNSMQGGAGMTGAAGNMAAAGVGAVAGAGGAVGIGGSAGASAGQGGGGAGGNAGSRWVGTWACAPQPTEAANVPPAPGLVGNTLRQMVRVSIGGEQLRLRLSNDYGTSAVSMSSVHLALAKGGGAIDATTDKALSFNGMPGVTIAAAQSVWSDPLDFKLAPLSDVAISIRFSNQTGDTTSHSGSRTTSFLQSGDAVSSATLSSAAKVEHWYYITGLDVMADASSGAVVVLGDSITDGRGSTTDQNNRWTDILAKQLQSGAATSKVGVLNLGIGGNAVLTGGLGPPAVERFSRDVLGQSGARWLIVLEGVNDIGDGKSSVTSGLIDAYKSFIAQSKQANLRAFGVPILPVVGSQYELGESQRKTVNEWIRNGGAYDAVIDLDAAVRDPSNQTRLLASYDSGDHLHPSPAGYKKMGESVDLSLFAK